MSGDNQSAPLSAQLADLRFNDSAGDFVRFRSVDLDDQVALVVRGATALEPDLRRAFRQNLSVDDVDTLRAFAMRRALSARRNASSNAIYDALNAFALLPHSADVPWDSWLKATLFVLRLNAGDLEMAQRQFADVAGPEVSDRFDVAVESMDRVTTIEQCRLVETSTNYGLGWLELLVYVSSGARGWTRGPGQMFDEVVPFEPITNLAQLAVSLADALDATGDVETSPLGQDQLVATEFSIVTSGSYLLTSGCLSFVATNRRDASAYTVYVTELDDEEDASGLADAAREIDGQAALSDGVRLVVLTPQPSFTDDDTTIDLEPALEVVRNVFATPAPLRPPA